jgi:hypothetical protein
MLYDIYVLTLRIFHIIIQSRLLRYKMYKYCLLFLLCIPCCLADSTAINKDKMLASSMTSYSTRLHPNQDIMTELLSRSKKYSLKAASIVSAVGSVLHCSLRFANSSYLTRV